MMPFVWNDSRRVRFLLNVAPAFILVTTLVYSRIAKQEERSLSLLSSKQTNLRQPKFKKHFISAPSLALHSGISNNPGLKSLLLLCGPVTRTDDFKIVSMLNHWNLTGPCPSATKNVSFLQNEPFGKRWKQCADQAVDPTILEVQNDTDALELRCPQYTSSPPSANIWLTSPLRDYHSNIYHMMVMSHKKGRGRDLWCFLDAALRFGEAQHSDTRRWRMEYRNETKESRYAQALFELLGSDTSSDFSSSTHLTLRDPPGGHLPPVAISHSFHFRPKTEPNIGLMDIASRVVRKVTSNVSLEDNMETPFVLLILRSNNERKVAGSNHGTATELVEALLSHSLHVRVMDLAYATVADQIAWFAAADVVIGMHGAGLTNLVWMNTKRPATLLEIAASYGWGNYLDDDWKCHRARQYPHYMKADFYNLAKRFNIRHQLLHPVYSSFTIRPSYNPINKKVFYVDANALARSAMLAME